MDWLETLHTRVATHCMIKRGPQFTDVSRPMVRSEPLHCLRRDVAPDSTVLFLGRTKEPVYEEREIIDAIP
jgi:hypothetical protein